MTAEDIVGNISLNLYKQSNNRIRDEENFAKLPDIIKDIIFIIDFDTELSINGILGFLENSTGLFLDDTIRTFKKIEAHEEYKILKNIQRMMLTYGISQKQLGNNLNDVNHYDITNFSETHGGNYSNILHEISMEARGLYLYQNERDIFANLLKYVDTNKYSLIDYLKDL